MKRTRAALVGLATVALASLTLASPAAAADPHVAQGTWQLRDWEGPYPDVDTSPASLSTVTCDQVTLIKPDTPDEPVVYPPTGNGDIGTSYENTDLNLPVNNGYQLLVDYTLSNTANAGAGAVRMFVYDTAGADTLNTAPSFPGIVGVSTVIAPESTPGTLSLNFTTGATIRTFGLTYDASNDTEATATFTNLRLEYFNNDNKVTVPISFCEPEAEEMPATGDSLTPILLSAAGLLVIGTVTVVITTRRRNRRA
jgi:hypothetical protein